jgi:hypothetical protein
MLILPGDEVKVGDHMLRTDGPWSSVEADEVVRVSGGGTVVLQSGSQEWLDPSRKWLVARPRST